MGHLIGTDEAGYGPNLGPLVISATAWISPDGVGVEELFCRLARVIASEVRHVRAANGPCVAMADSKALYGSGKGLRHLERGLWAALRLLGHRLRTWRDVWIALAPDAVGTMSSIPWYVEYDEPAPVDCEAEEIEPLAEALRGWFGGGRRTVGGSAEPGDLRGGVQRSGRAARLERGGAFARNAGPGRPVDRVAAAWPRFVGLRQARRPRPLWAAAGRAFSRVADRGPPRGTAAERISFWSG